MEHVFVYKDTPHRVFITVYKVEQMLEPSTSSCVLHSV